jgi:hypothetical protein
MRQVKQSGEPAEAEPNPTRTDPANPAPGTGGKLFARAV